MPQLLIILCLINSVYHASSSRVSKLNHSDSHTPTFINYDSPNRTERPRVFNGQPVSHSSFPFAVSMLALGKGKWYYKCGGSIISRTAVLSAAHCVMVYPSYPGATCYPATGIYYIIAGADYVWGQSRFREESPVSAVYAHPSCFYFTSSILGFDTSVLMLRNAFVYNEEVQPLNIYSGDANANLREFDRLASAGTECHVVGYGQTFSSQSMQFMLMGNLRLMTNDECARTKCSYDRYFCNINFLKYAWSCGSTAVSTPCRGDSGGPFVCNGLVFGTVSWGMGCFSGLNNPAFFADMQAVTYMVVRYGDRNYATTRKQDADDGHSHLPSSYYIMASLLAPLIMNKAWNFYILD